MLKRQPFTISSNIVPSMMVGLDSFIILMSGFLSYDIIVAEHDANAEFYVSAVCFFWLTCIALMNFAGQYRFNVFMTPLENVDKIIIAFATTLLFGLAAAFSLKLSAVFSRIWLVAFFTASVVAVFATRLIASRITGRLVDLQVFTRNVVILGEGAQATQFLAHIAKSSPRFISVLGVFTAKPECLRQGSTHYQVLGTVDDLPPYIRTNKVDDVIIALPWSTDRQIMAAVEIIRELPVAIYLAVDLVGFGLRLSRPPDHFEDLRLFEIVAPPLAGWSTALKSGLDYSLGVLLILVTAPVMAVIAIAIKLDGPGPVIFRQARYGYANKVFHIFKFRTMTESGGTRGHTRQATPGDPRVTRVGRFLRRSSLDELPQLFNVLRGEMSIVGPRPHAVDHNEQYAQLISGYFARHRVKPGITGWAQVNGLRGETGIVGKMERRVEFDVYYAENWSFLFDLKILLMTLVVCLSGKNAY